MMGMTKGSIYLILISCQFCYGTVPPELTLEEAIDKLNSTEHVSGSSVYSSGTPGGFYLLSKTIIKNGREGFFLKLASGENPVVRSMGLLCLAKYNKRESADKIRTHLADRGIIKYVPGGCIVQTVTVGNFARELLRDVNCLEHNAKPFPLLSKDELTALDIEILSKDSTFWLHAQAAATLSNTFVKKKDSFTLRNLKSFVPNLKSYQIIKAIGRLEPSPMQRKFLISCLHNKDLDHESRLAAASALTRHTSKAARKAIEREKPYLNSIDQHNRGNIFLETLQFRKNHEKLMKPLHAEDTWRGMEKIKHKVIKAFSNSHPIAFFDLEQSFTLAITSAHNDVRIAVASSLIDMSKNSKDFNQAWNTYSDTPYALQRIVQLQPRSPLPKLTKDELAEIEKNIQTLILK